MRFSQNSWLHKTNLRSLFYALLREQWKAICAVPHKYTKYRVVEFGASMMQNTVRDFPALLLGAVGTVN